MDPLVRARGSLTISTDPDRVDRKLVHEVLSNSYWAQGIPREIVDRSIDNSLVFGLYEGSAQIGFARVITDRSTFAYLSDVFVLESHRARGLGKWLMEVIMGHPDLQGLRRWTLATRDAHGLYRQFGFRPIAAPDRLMEILDMDIYGRESPKSKIQGPKDEGTK
jgi:GNAT superfamily N-acetyltransferase